MFGEREKLKLLNNVVDVKDEVEGIAKQAVQIQALGWRKKKKIESRCFSQHRPEMCTKRFVIVK